MKISNSGIMAFMAAVFFIAACGGAREPVEDIPAVQDADSVRRISIVLGGDVMQHLTQVHSARRDSTYDYAECFRYVKPFFDSADLVIVNFETTVSGNGRYSGYPLFSSPPHLAHALRDCGADIVTLANNHMADKGRSGLEHTMAAIDSAGLRRTGVFLDSAEYRSMNPLYVDVKGVRLALFNYTYGLNGMPAPKGSVVNLIDTVRIAADLARIDRSATDHIMIYFHWGDEYVQNPGKAQRELADWCHARGVDFVIGSHPHVLQPVETVRDSAGAVRGVTAFSLGNMVSNQRQRRTDGGMLLKIDIEHVGSARPSISASYMLTWVYMPYREGRLDYKILPLPVADTMLAGDPYAKRAFDLFVSDSHRLLSRDTTIREITAGPQREAAIGPGNPLP